MTINLRTLNVVLSSGKSFSGIAFDHLLSCNCLYPSRQEEIIVADEVISASLENPLALNETFTTYADNLTRKIDSIKSTAFILTEIQNALYAVARIIATLAVRALIAPIGIVYNGSAVIVYSVASLCSSASATKAAHSQKATEHVRAFFADFLNSIDILIIAAASVLCASTSILILKAVFTLAICYELTAVCLQLYTARNPISQQLLSSAHKAAFFLKTHFGFVSSSGMLCSSSLVNGIRACPKNLSADNFRLDVYTALKNFEKHISQKLFRKMLDCVSYEQFLTLKNNANSSIFSETYVVTILEQGDPSPGLSKLLSSFKSHLSIGNKIKEFYPEAYLTQDLFLNLAKLSLQDSWWAKIVSLSNELTNKDASTNAAYTNFKEKVRLNPPLDPYQLLGLDPSHFTSEDCNKKYRQLALLFHADKTKEANALTLAQILQEAKAFIDRVTLLHCESPLPPEQLQLNGLSYAAAHT